MLAWRAGEEKNEDLEDEAVLAIEDDDDGYDQVEHQEDGGNDKVEHQKDGEQVGDQVEIKYMVLAMRQYFPDVFRPGS